MPVPPYQPLDAPRAKEKLSYQKKPRVDLTGNAGVPKVAAG